MKLSEILSEASDSPFVKALQRALAILVHIRRGATPEERAVAERLLGTMLDKIEQEFGREFRTRVEREAGLPPASRNAAVSSGTNAIAHPQAHDTTRPLRSKAADAYRKTQGTAWPPGSLDIKV